jgi:membrane protein implicated in regulation of membrane protease activity
MIQREPFPAKTVCLWALLVLCGLSTAYIVFIAVVCISVGLTRFPQDGFWVPVLTGGITAILILWLFGRVCRGTLNKMKEKDSLDL